jgi:hypothetical protein
MTEKTIMFMMKRMEEKLRELMGDDAFTDFSVALAKEAFRQDIYNMADDEFKNFCVDNFDVITGGQQNEQTE